MVLPSDVDSDRALLDRGDSRDAQGQPQGQLRALASICVRGRGSTALERAALAEVRHAKVWYAVPRSRELLRGWRRSAKQSLGGGGHIVVALPQSVQRRGARKPHTDELRDESFHGGCAGHARRLLKRRRRRLSGAAER